MKIIKCDKKSKWVVHVSFFDFLTQEDDQQSRISLDWVQQRSFVYVLSALGLLQTVE